MTNTLYAHKQINSQEKNGVRYKNCFIVYILAERVNRQEVMDTRLSTKQAVVTAL